LRFSIIGVQSGSPIFTAMQPKDYSGLTVEGAIETLTYFGGL
jgi:hypothetical protein